MAITHRAIDQAPSDLRWLPHEGAGTEVRTSIGGSAQPGRATQDTFVGGSHVSLENHGQATAIDGP